jgi:hypothetical protein
MVNVRILLLATILLASVAFGRDAVIHLTPTSQKPGLLQTGDGVTISGDGTGGYPRTATWRSGQVESPGLVEVLPSWSVDTPDGTGIRVSVRVRTGDDWSPWLDLGYWGEVPPPTDSEAFDGGKVAVDILELDEPADAWDVRVMLYSFAAEAAPTLRRVSVATRAVGDAPDPGTADWHGTLDVPFLPQTRGGTLLQDSICSPTSIAMALAFHGIDVDVGGNARQVYDREHGIFGNWNRAVAQANQQGATAWIEYITTWPQVAQHLRAGRVVVASVNYEDGEAPSFLDNATDGHLIVIRGLTLEGDAVVNDPGSRDRGEAIVYAKADLERAWFRNAGGVSYVVGPPAKP